MARICPSCGGVVGRDCFNPVECAQITQRMQHEELSRYNEGYKQALIDQNTNPEPSFTLQDMLNAFDEGFQYCCRFINGDPYDEDKAKYFLEKFNIDITTIK